MSDQIDLKDQLAAYIDAIAEPVDGPAVVQTAAPSPPGRRRIWLAVAAGAAVPALAVLAVVFFLGRTPETTQPPVATDPPSTTQVETTAVPTTTPPTTVPPSTAAPVQTQPSQSPESAAAFGIDPLLAALPLELRANILVSIEAEGFTWAIARPPDEVLMTVRGRLGCDPNANGADLYPVDLFCSVEYAEILMIGDDGSVIAAYPMPNATPSWIEVTPQAVYAGRIGDGAQPDSTLVRIDGPSLELAVIVFPFESQPDAQWPDRWVEATPEQQDALPSLLADDQRAVASWIGDIAVDIAGVERLFAEAGLVSACTTEGAAVPEADTTLPEAVRSTVGQLRTLAAICDADGANALLAAGGGQYIPSHFLFEDGIGADGFLALDTVYGLLDGEFARLDSNTMLGTGFEPVATGPVYVWPAAAAEGMLGFMSEADQQQFIEDFGQEAFDAMVAEVAFPGPQLRIAEDGRWVLYAQLDS